MFTTFIEPTDWVISISEAQRSQTWQISQTQPVPWKYYVNQLCLESLLAWLRTDYLPNARSWVETSEWSAFWHLMHGSAIDCDGKRIAIVPTESIDQSEILVAQEWVDIPSWSADYYLAVQLSPDAEMVLVYGYVTHQQLKQQGTYDASDRTYSLDVDDLTSDINTLWIAQRRFHSEQTRAAIAPLAEVSAVQAENLLQRLVDADFPRLTIPFSQWGALLDTPAYRQQLYAQRTGNGSVMTAATSAMTQLGNWLDGRIDSIWQSLDQVLLPQQIAVAVRGEPQNLPINMPSTDAYRAKVYPVGEAQIALVIGISQVDADQKRINLQIHPALGTVQLPGLTRLRLLDQDNIEVSQASASMTETIQLQFRAHRGEQFKVELTCQEQTFTEEFAL